MRRILLVLVSFLIFAAPAAATLTSAAKPYTKSTALQAAKQAALDHWPSLTCGFVLTVSNNGSLGSTSGCSAQVSEDMVAQSTHSPGDFVSMCSFVAYEADEILNLSVPQFNPNATTSQCLAAANHRYYVIYRHPAVARIMITNGICTARFKYVPKLKPRTSHLTSEVWPCSIE